MGRSNPGYQVYQATLRVFGNKLDLKAITRRLGVKPDHAHKKGERRLPTVRPFRHDSWQLTARVSDTRPLKAHLRWLAKRLAKKTSFLRGLSAKYEVDVYCRYHSNYDRGSLEMPPEVLKWCANMGVPIRVSILVQD